MKAEQLETIRQVIRDWPTLERLDQEAATNWLQHQPFVFVAIAADLEGFDISNILDEVPSHIPPREGRAHRELWKFVEESEADPDERRE